MPWCEDCEKYWAPSAMTPEGECPDCGADLEAPEPVGSGPATTRRAHRGTSSCSIVMLVVYLVYRGYEMFFA